MIAINKIYELFHGATYLLTFPRCVQVSCWQFFLGDYLNIVYSAGASSCIYKKNAKNIFYHGDQIVAEV